MSNLRILFILFFIFTSCSPKIKTNLDLVPLIPIPNSSTSRGASFVITEKTKLSFDKSNKDLKLISQNFREVWRSITSYDLSLDQTRSEILIEIDNSKLTDKEAYVLDISKNNIKLIGSSAEAVFRGIKTLEQLLRLQHSIKLIDKPIIIPTGKISDKPKYSYRGSMLDVARHFFSVDDVKNYIDLLALYKFNYLHLHLSDDQGWRIEIKSWPKLTEYGGSTQVGGKPGGFYTQSEYVEIINYAEENYITIIPEIDIPGHTNSALASYSELNCNNKATKLYTGTEVGFSSLCLEREETFKFLDDVIREITNLTPGPYFHIGGDETHATSEQDYLIFIKSTLEIVKKYGKTGMGWADIAKAQIPKSTLIQYWSRTDKDSIRNKKAIQEVLIGVDKGANIVMSPASLAYMDMKYNDSTKLGLTWAGIINTKKAYDWLPENLIPRNKNRILGIEAPLWTETAENFEELTFLAFPRIIGYSEIGWSQTSQRKWIDYRERLAHHGKLLKNLSIVFYESPMIDWK